jgi:hypothetical protein
VKYEREKMRKEEVVAYLDVIFRQYAGGTGRNHDKPQAVFSVSEPRPECGVSIIWGACSAGLL